MDSSYYEEPEKFDPDRWEGNESNTLQGFIKIIKYK